MNIPYRFVFNVQLSVCMRAGGRWPVVFSFFFPFSPRNMISVAKSPAPTPLFYCKVEENLIAHFNLLLTLM